MATSLFSNRQTYCRDDLRLLRAVEPMKLDQRKVFYWRVPATRIQWVLCYNTLMSIPNVVYHYTTITNLAAIVNGQDRESGAELWASDLEFMNDPTELRYAYSVLSPFLEEERASALRREKSFHHPEYATLLSTHLGSLVSELSERLEGNGMSLPLGESRLYSLSFCENGDLLSMWRGYGSGGGAAIGIDPHVLLDSGSKMMLDTDLFPVSYGPSAVESDFPPLIHKYLDNRLGHPGVESEHFASTQLLPLMAHVKDPAYSEEKEWRALFRPNSCMSGQASLRGSSRGLVPYIGIPLPEGSIKEVVIGPSAHAKRDVAALSRGLTRSRGYWDQFPVRQSEVPYVY